MRIPAALPCLVAALLATRAAVAVEIDASGLFASLDADADGRVTIQESGDSNARLFARLLRTSDEDRDGQLTAEEFAVGLTPVRAEKDLVVKQGSRLPGSDALMVMLARMDANADRRLDAGEVPPQLRDVFERMLAQGDADKNGRLDTRELAESAPQLGITAQAAAGRLGIDVPRALAALPPERRQALEQMNAFPNPQEMMADPAQAADLFARLDANANGLLSADEAPDGLGRLLRRADINGDGKLSAAEFQQAAKRMAAADAPLADPAAARRNVRQMLNRLDRNGDGQLSRSEVPRRMAGNFDRLDSDGGGTLDAEELQRSGVARGTARGPGAGPVQPQMDEQMQ